MRMVSQMSDFGLRGILILFTSWFLFLLLHNIFSVTLISGLHCVHFTVKVIASKAVDISHKAVKTDTKNDRSSSCKICSNSKANSGIIYMTDLSAMEIEKQIIHNRKLQNSRSRHHKPIT